MSDIAVVGGGIVGTSVAYHLVDAGEDVILFDAMNDGRATDAGAGIVAAAPVESSGDWYAFAREAVQYYPELDAALERRLPNGESTGYARCPLITVDSGGQAMAFKTVTTRIRERAEREGYPPTEMIGEISTSAAQEHVPSLAAVDNAFRSEATARVDGRRFTDAMRTAAVEDGLRVRKERVKRVTIADDTVSGVITADESYNASRVVVTAGAWSSGLLANLGVSVEITPVRGQIAHLGVDADTAGWEMAQDGDGNYLVPWPDGRIVAGATHESTTGFDARTTTEGVASVLDNALTLAPGLADATLDEVRVGLRPQPPDGKPLLGSISGVDGAFVGTGHGATGLQLGPYSGRVLADIVRDRTPPSNVDAFDPSRFA